MVPESIRILRTLLTSQERRRALFLVAVMLVGTTFEAAGVGIVIPVIAVITTPDLLASYPSLAPVLYSLGSPSQSQLIVTMLVAMVFLFTVKAVVLAAVNRAQLRFAFDLQSSLSQRLFKTYMSQPWPFHQRRNSAELIHNITAATNLLTFNTTLPAITAIGELLVATAIVAVLLVAEPFGTLVISTLLAVTALVFHRVTRRSLAEWGRLRQEHETLRLKHLQQGIGGIKDIIVLGRQEHFVEAVRQHSDISFCALRRQLFLQRLPRLWMECIAVAGVAGVTAAMVAAGRPVETIAPIVGLFAAAAFRLMPAVNNAMSALGSLKFGEATARVLRDEFALALSEEPVPVSGRLRLTQSLDLDSVGFKYPGNEYATLNGVRLRIAHGQVIGIIGRSGAGKSTLLDLVLGLLKPTEGTVRADGQDIHASVRAWRKSIGYVPQAIYLTDDTLRRNVAMGLPDSEIDEAAVLAAIAGSQLTEFVRSLPDGLDSVVGERGVRLSGGQRQRIGIARALLHDPDLLVLDEATSALDDETETAFMESIRALRGSRTILIVAHRTTTLRECDRVYRIERGHVQECTSGVGESMESPLC